MENLPLRKNFYNKRVHISSPLDLLKSRIQYYNYDSLRPILTVSQNQRYRKFLLIITDMNAKSCVHGRQHGSIYSGLVYVVISFPSLYFVSYFDAF